MFINRDKFNFLPVPEMKEEHWQTLLAMGTPKSVKAGTMLYEQSMKIHELSCIIEGSVKLVHFFDNGNERLYESLSAPAVLGTDALWFGGSTARYPSIIALTDVTFTVVPIEAAQQLMQDIPDMIIAMYRCVRNSMCISRIRSVCAAPMSLLQKAALAIAFMREADKDGEGYMTVTHEELAQLIGISRANVTMALAELVDMKLISKKRGKVKILDNDKLMEFLDDPF